MQNKGLNLLAFKIVEGRERPVQGPDSGESRDKRR
jgi:hypothetical protein